MKNRPLYVISIVAEMLEIHPQTLRQYERIGLIKPSRTIGNNRLYSEEDIEKLKFIITLTKDMGVNLAGTEIILNMKEQMEALQRENEILKQYIKAKLGEEVVETSQQSGIVPKKQGDIIKVTITRDE
jgi:MerR family transcriptional regulator/heat shock protein HspR